MDVDHQAVITASLLWAAAVFSPGPAFAAIAHRAVSADRGTAYLTVLGITAGSCLYGVATLFGLLAVLGWTGALAEIVRWAGAGYLIWLGVQAWRAPHTDSLAAGSESGRVPEGAFVQGLLIEMGNPKGIAFFVSVFAVAVPADASVATKLVILAGGLAIELAWYILAATLLAAGPLRLIYRRARRLIDRVFGALFIGLGLHLILGRH